MCVCTLITLCHHQGFSGPAYILRHTSLPMPSLALSLLLPSLVLHILALLMRSHIMLRPSEWHPPPPHHHQRLSDPLYDTLIIIRGPHALPMPSILAFNQALLVLRADAAAPLERMCCCGLGRRSQRTEAYALSVHHCVQNTGYTHSLAS